MWLSVADSRAVAVRVGEQLCDEGESERLGLPEGVVLADRDSVVAESVRSVRVCDSVWVMTGVAEWVWLRVAVGVGVGGLGVRVVLQEGEGGLGEGVGVLVVLNVCVGETEWL